MTGPPKLDSRITIGVSTKRGPISTSDIFVSPRSGFGGLDVFCFLEPVWLDSSAATEVSGMVSDFEMAVSLIWKHRTQILPSAIVKPMTWSTNGLDLRAPFGTLKICVRSS